MRPSPLLLAATVLIAGLVSSSHAADPADIEPPAPPTETSAPAAAADEPTAAVAEAMKPETPESPAATVAETAPDTSATETPAATATESPAVPPPPQVITAQIDPELALRLSLLEKTMLAQTQGQAAIYTETTRLLMFFGSACVAMGLIAMVAAVFLMNRTLASVSTITAQVAHAQGSVPALPAPGALVTTTPAQPGGFEKVQASGQRFQSRMTSLEQRLEELEHLAGHGAPATAQVREPATSESPAGITETAETPAPRRVIPMAAILIRKSETLMNLGKLDEAMAALDEAARHEGDPAEIHLARGRVQEKLGRLGDALQSYDLAVTNDQTNTAALLMKAGVLNRQERFEEALSCYERALAVHRASN